MKAIDTPSLQLNSVGLKNNSSKKLEKEPISVAPNNMFISLSLGLSIEARTNRKNEAACPLA